MKRLLGIIALVLGVVLIGVSYHIKNQVNEGQMEVNSAQRTVNTGSSLFNTNPVSKEVGKGITSGAQRRIDAGQSEIDYYTNLAHWLMIGGVACLIVGAGAILLGGRRSSH